MVYVLSQSLHNLIFSTLCIVLLLLLKRPLLKNGGHFCYFYLWLLPVFMLCNPISFVVAVPWDGFRQVVLLESIIRSKVLGYGIFLAWFTGSCISVLKIFLDMKKLQRNVLAATDESDARTSHLFEERKRALGIKRPVMLRTIHANISPLIAVARTPIIVIPSVEMHESSLALVLDHELNHLKHRDTFVKALAYIVRPCSGGSPFPTSL